MMTCLCIELLHICNVNQKITNAILDLIVIYINNLDNLLKKSSVNTCRNIGRIKNGELGIAKYLKQHGRMKNTEENIVKR